MLSRLRSFSLFLLLVTGGLMPASVHGAARTPVPVEVSNLTAALNVDSKFTQSCAARADGSVWCWGGWVTGTPGVYDVIDQPVKVGGITTAKKVILDSNIMCVIHTDADATLDCWVFDATKDAGGVRYPAGLLSYGSGLTGVIDVVEGQRGTICALKSDGTVWCFGDGWYGQLGDGQDYFQRNAFKPVQVVGITTAKAIAVGNRHACAVLATAAVSCWGELPGGTAVTNVPVAVSGLPPVSAIAAADAHTCAVTTAGEAWCWGANYAGELGAPNGPVVSPRRVEGVQNLKSIAITDAHTCAAATDGSAWCWGSNDDFALGAFSTTTGVPTKVGALSRVAAITVGDAFSCALIDGGTARCWGSDAAGQLGNGAAQYPTESLSPAEPKPTPDLGSQQPATLTEQPATLAKQLATPAKPAPHAVAPPAAQVLNGRLRLTGVKVPALASGRCPKSVSLLVRRKGAKGGASVRRQLKMSVSAPCTVTGSVSLPAKLRGRSLWITLTATVGMPVKLTVTVG